MNSKWFALSFAVISLVGCKTTDLNRVSDVLVGLQQQPLSEQTVVAGLKQALDVGIKKTVAQTNRTGGFSNNPLIKIAVPDELANVAKKVRQIGFGSYVDKFELQMNRAAEKASGASVDIFVSAITRMSIADAWTILRGEQDAATRYFRQATEQSLRHKFQPIVTSSMQKVGFYRDYKKLLNTYNSIPFVQKPDLDIENYVLDKSLEGLFQLIAQEEKHIRNDPVARTTDLLRKVFAQQ